MGFIANKMLADFLDEQKKRGRLWLWLLFGIYALLLCWVVIFKADFSWPYVRSERALNLIPFFYADIPAGNIPFDVTANIAVFLPFGIYLKMFGLDTRVSLLSGALTSLCFESLQYIFAIGVADVTDLVTNTAGTALGVIIFLLSAKLFKTPEKQDRFFKILASVVTALALLLFLVLLVADR